MIDVIAFDADDTLWHNEPLFLDTKNKFQKLLAAYHSPEWIEQRLYETEMRNLEHFGYGIKSFTLSMIETAIELTEGRVSGSDVQQIIDLAKAMLDTPIRLLDGVDRGYLYWDDDLVRRNYVRCEIDLRCHITYPLKTIIVRAVVRIVDKCSKRILIITSNV